MVRNERRQFQCQVDDLFATSPRHSIRMLALLGIVITISLLTNSMLMQALINSTINQDQYSHIPLQFDNQSPEMSKEANAGASVDLDPVLEIYNGYKVDVLSVASNKRPTYVETQRRTWADHPLVRNFFNVTEDLDTDPQGIRSCQSLPLKDVLKVPKWCRKTYLGGNSSSSVNQSSWIMQRYVHYYARKSWLKQKANPAGWLCAQKRFPIGLSRVVQGYQKRGESLPDYLLVVDDDTYYNMDTFDSVVVQKLNSQDPFVAAGCRVTNGRSKEAGIVFSFGGFGLTFSKGSLERFLRPLSVSNPMSNDRWANSTIKAIDENLLSEKSSFRDGMNVAELMEAFALEEPFQNVKEWTRGYCFHGHWVLALFSQLYGLHSSYYMGTLQDSEITLKSPKRGPQYSNLCKNEYQHCVATDLTCHYQTPSDMERLALEKDDKISLPERAIEAPQTPSTDVNIRESQPISQPMIIVKSRFMQFQPDLLALGKARLLLFQTFCLPSLVAQRAQNFLWIIRVDPELREEILLPMKKMLEPYSDRFFLIASNDNKEGFRDLKVDSMRILSGDRSILQNAIAKSQGDWLVETRLDADDGLHMKLLESISHRAKELQQTSLPSTEWRAFCVRHSMNWHSGALSPISEVNPNVTNTLNIPSKGILSDQKHGSRCITPGLSYVLPPHIRSPPMIGHHVLHKEVPMCDTSFDISTKKCLEMFDLPYIQAIQARTPTSHGMGGFHKEYKKKRGSSKLWKILNSGFNISVTEAIGIIEDFKTNIVEIAKDNLAGQCTDDHSCTRFAKRYLERIVWNKELEENEFRNETA